MGKFQRHRKQEVSFIKHKSCHCLCCRFDFTTIDIFRRFFISKHFRWFLGFHSWMKSQLAGLFRSDETISLRNSFLLNLRDLFWLATCIESQFVLNFDRMVRLNFEMKLYLSPKISIKKLWCKFTRNSYPANCFSRRSVAPRDRQIESRVRHRRKASRTTAKLSVSSCRSRIWCIDEWKF